MKRALLVIDVQGEYFDGKLPVSHPANSFTRILQAMDAAERHEVPVVVIRHNGPPERGVFVPDSAGWQLHPQIERGPVALLIDKWWPDSFADTALEAWLRAREIATLTITGYMTQMCCDTTARRAFHLGFGVEFLCDATGTLDFVNAAGEVTAEELHRAVLVTQARFGEVLSTQDWVTKLRDG